MDKKNIQLLLIAAAVVAVIVYYRKHSKEMADTEAAKTNAGTSSGAGWSASGGGGSFSLGNGDGNGWQTDINKPIEVAAGVGPYTQTQTAQPGQGWGEIGYGDPRTPRIQQRPQDAVYRKNTNQLTQAPQSGNANSGGLGLGK